MWKRGQGGFCLSLNGRHSDGFGLFQHLTRSRHSSYRTQCHGNGVGVRLGRRHVHVDTGTGNWTSIREGPTTSHTHTSTPSIMSLMYSRLGFGGFRACRFRRAHFIRVDTSALGGGWVHGTILVWFGLYLLSAWFLRMGYLARTLSFVF